MIGFITTVSLVLLSLPSGAMESLADGDAAFFRIEYPLAIALYTDGLQQSPDNPEFLWRLARAYVCRGEVAPEEEREVMFQAAEGYAMRCTRADSLLASGHTWRAAALGYLALHAGMKDQVWLSRELISEVELAIALNPIDGAAYSIKGSFYRALGNVSWFQRQLAEIFLGNVPDGGYEQSETALKQAIALAPDVMRHHYELAVLYIDWDRHEEARDILVRAAQLPVRVAIDRERLVRIQELLSSLNDVK
ncbi:MAG TPA: tetratricopeptide repeat protein [Bacteroidota bacterium]|nr:tetratricopeptide repeat protein [Bacteroidota bacterium]